METFTTAQLLAELELRFRIATPNEPARLAILQASGFCDTPDLQHRGSR